MAKKQLHTDLIDFNSSFKTEIFSFGDDKISPSNNPFDAMMKTAETFATTNTGSASLQSCNNIDMCNGRESLGVLQFDITDIKFNDADWLEVPDIKVNDIAWQNISDQLNTALLYSYRSNKSSIFSSPSSFSSTFFNFCSCDISNIQSLIGNNNIIESTSILNKAFVNFSDKSNTNVKMDSETYNESKQTRKRIQSLPVELNNYSNSKASRRRSDWKKCFTLPWQPKQDVEDNEFNDSVFIEGQYIASKLADGSILDLDNGELFSLDHTPLPKWFDECDAVEENNNPGTTEHIFKSVDKIMPPVNVYNTVTSEKNIDIDEKIKCIMSNDEHVLKNTDSGSNVGKVTEIIGSNNNSLHQNECLRNVSDTVFSDNKKLSTSHLSHCSNNSKSKDAKSILHNLSEIFNNDSPSTEQITEGQNLLRSLADILSANNTENSSQDREQSEDSGHSSIEQNLSQNSKLEDKALDLRLNSNSPIFEDESKPLDLSITKKKIPNELNKFSTNLTAINTNIERNTKVATKISPYDTILQINDQASSSIPSTNSTNLRPGVSGLPTFGKLKPKKVEKKVIPDKGPLKAVIPVGNMAKPKGVGKINRISCTPPKENASLYKYNSKRTSTPKMIPKLQPVAQSTPEGNCELQKQLPTASQLKQRNYGGTVSPLARTVNVSTESIEEINNKNRSGSAPNLSASSSMISRSIIPPNKNQVICRRRSASDLKMSKDSVQFRRSNTIDKDCGIATTLTRVRENIGKARSVSVGGMKAAVGANIDGNKAVLRERNRVSNTSNIKPCNLMSKIRKSTAKENIKK